MEKSADGTLKNTYGCTKTNTRSYKASYSMAMLVSTSAPKSGTSSTAAKPTSLIPPRVRSGPHPPYKTTLMTALLCFKISSTTNGLQPPVLPPSHRSELNECGKMGGGGTDTEPDMSVDDRYYTGREYATLSKAKKLGLKLKRQKRGHKPGNKGKSRTAPKPTTGDRTTRRIIKALTKLIAAEGQSEDDNTIDNGPSGPMDTNTNTGTNASNRANKALQRRK